MNAGLAHDEITLYWHDYETSGADPQRDRPLQFAGVRTDLDLNIIGEPLMLYCKPADDLLPHPEACLITGITPQTALAEGVCEAEFIDRIHQELSRPGTCGVGYNSLRFDDEVTRHTLYRNFFDPYAREWQNGNSRWDIIDMLRLTRALRPQGIEWPSYEDGTPSLRLEDLTRANGIDHGSAHDALSDVYATIAVARLVRERQPRLYDYLFRLRDKRQVAEMLDVATFKPVLHVSSKYPVEQGNLSVVAPLAQHPVNKNGVIVFDLRQDPGPLIELPVETLRQRLFVRRDALPDGVAPLPLKVVHSNRCPVLAPAGMLNTEEAARFAISGDLCRQHLLALRQAPGLTKKVRALFESPAQAAGDPDLMLYGGGFFGPADRQMMERIRACEPELLGELDPAFQDPRLEEMWLRYRGRNYPQSLSPEEQATWEAFRRERLLGGGEGWLNFERFYQRLNELAQQPGRTPDEMHILEELAAYGEAIYPFA